MQCMQIGFGSSASGGRDRLPSLLAVPLLEKIEAYFFSQHLSSISRARALQGGAGSATVFLCQSGSRRMSTKTRCPS